MPSTRVLGESGTTITDGYLSDVDYKTEWEGQNRIDLVERMRKSDSSVQIGLKALKLPIESTEWFIEAASEDEKDQEVADFVDQVFLKDMNFFDVLRRTLTYLDFGYVVQEIIWTDKEWNGKTLWAVKDLADRLQGTIDRWETSNGKPGVTQNLIDSRTKGDGSIPAEKMITLANEKEGENFEGVSVLRSAWKHYDMKDKYYRIHSVATERQGMGIPKATKRKTSQSITKEQRQELIKTLKNLRAHHEGYLIENSEYEIEFMDMKGNTVIDPTEMIQHHDRKILQAMFSQFLVQGESGTGSYAQSKTDVEFLFLNLNSIAKQIRGTYQTVIDRMVRANFDVEDTPKLKFRKIGNIDWNQFSLAMERLSKSKMLTPTTSTERHMRNSLNLPALTDEEEDQIEQDKQDAREMAKQAKKAKEAGAVIAKGDKPEEEKDKKSKEEKKTTPEKEEQKKKDAKLSKSFWGKFKNQLNESINEFKES